MRFRGTEAEHVPFQCWSDVRLESETTLHAAYQVQIESSLTGVGRTVHQPLPHHPQPVDSVDIVHGNLKQAKNCVWSRWPHPRTHEQKFQNRWQKCKTCWHRLPPCATSENTLDNFYACPWCVLRSTDQTIYTQVPNCKMYTVEYDVQLN